MSSSDRKPYLSSTSIDQDLLDDCSDNLENRLEMVVEIQTPDGTIYASDRNKYVGSTFYEALLNFPVINRTIGEWLAPDLQFSSINIDLSNVDGRFNKYLPGGASFGNWIGKRVLVKLGIAESLASYRTIFEGFVTDIGGFKRSVSSITIIARDKFDTINVNFPKVLLTKTSYPMLEEKNINKLLPVIYGSWKEELEPDPAIVPSYCTNGTDPLVDFKERIVEISIGSPAIFTCNEHHLQNGDKVQLNTSGALPSPLVAESDYYVKNISGDITFELSTTPGGGSISTSGGQSGVHKFIASPTATARNSKYVISENSLKELVATEIYMKRSEVYNLVPIGEIENIGTDNRTFEVKQRTATLWVDNGESALVAYEWDSGDEFFIRCIGLDLDIYTDNLISQCKHILLTHGGIGIGDFDSSWDSYRSKSAPAESAIAQFKSRIWLQEAQGALSYVLSMLEQVRLEAFIDANLKLKLSSLHFDEFVSNPTFVIKNWDIEKGSFTTSVDDKNNFNRAQAVFNFSPIRNENARSTKIHKNQDSITQIGKEISKKLVFPNLYQETVVSSQLIEILKLASATIEIISCTVTWRSLLKDISQFALLDVKIGSSEFELVPCQIREIGYDPQGLKLPIKLWSFQMCPYPGYEPGYAGTVGGFNANITFE
jgi:hypothetical protein